MLRSIDRCRCGLEILTRENPVDPGSSGATTEIVERAYRLGTLQRSRPKRIYKREWHIALQQIPVSL